MQPGLVQMEAVGLQLFEELCFWELIAHLLHVKIFIFREGLIPGNRFLLVEGVELLPFLHLLIPTFSLWAFARHGGGGWREQMAAAPICTRPAGP